MLIACIMFSFFLNASHAMQQQIAAPASLSPETAAPGGSTIGASSHVEQTPYTFTLTREKTLLKGHGVVLQITLINNVTKHWIGQNRFFAITHNPEPKSILTSEGTQERVNRTLYCDSPDEEEFMKKIFAQALKKFLEIETGPILPDSEATKSDITFHFNMSSDNPLEPGTPLIEKPQEPTSTLSITNLISLTGLLLSYCTIQ